MATKTITEVLDDMDQTTGAENIKFSVGGVDYEMDLAEKNMAKFAKAVQPFIAVAREVAPVKKSTGKNPEAALMRAWAVENKLDVPARGRISAEVQEAYRAAHATATA